MKFTIAIFLLVAACHAAEPPNRGRQKAKDTLPTNKREVEEGGNVEKRATLPTAAPSPTPGVEYADSKESQQDKSPAQQVYATPGPQIAKISDLLTGQGPPFQAAIASQLYSPISVYQPRLGAPTTFELSPPIPSQLAYSEHKIYQQQPNAGPVVTPAPFKLLPNYQPAYQQQILLQPQPPQQFQPQPIAPPQQLQPQQLQPQQLQPQQLQTQQLQPQQLQLQQLQPQQLQSQQLQPQQLQPQPIAPPQQLQLQPNLPPQQPPQQFLQQIPQNYQQPQFQLIRPLQYFQGPSLAYPAPPPGLYLRNQIQLPYLQAPQLIPVQFQPFQPGIVYAQNAPQNLPILQKPQQGPEEQQPQRQQIVEKPEPQQQIQKPSFQIRPYSQPQGAVSYASFSQSPPSRLYLPKEPQESYQPQQQQALQPPRLTLQFRGQPLNTHIKPEGAENLETASSKSLNFRPGATLQLQPVQQQALPQQPLLIQNSGYGAQQLNASPTFPPVQYFGKNAQKIFPRYSSKS